MKRLLALVSLLILSIGCTPPADPPPSATPPTTTAGSDDGAAEFVSIHVPNMHCPVMCWPKVKEALEAQEGVAEVVLAEQSKEDEIDNPYVNVKVTPEFNADKAVDALAVAGFADSTIE